MDFTPGTHVDGFVVRRVTPVDVMSSTAIELEHEASGAGVIHLANADTENLFSVAFRTPPPNDTGLPHIMEHSVLAGSKRYPGKDPFFALVKSSVASFINAMTAYDHTVYPVASTVRQDLFNLADVYWDAVFHPLLTKHTFGREGHRTELADPNDLASELVTRGIVYSEMQGVYSSPDSLIAEAMRRKLLADTIYGRDSGGDPERIPELTYEQYRAFHERYYHPSNALIFLYGNIPTRDFLGFLKDRLSGYERRAPVPAFSRQPRWTAPRAIDLTYPADAEQAGHAYLVLSWVFGDGADPLDATALQLLSRVLLGNEAAPLRKALIDAKIGDDLALAGSETDSFDSTFSVGVKGAKPANAAAFVSVVEQTLQSLAKGIRREAIEAAAQQLAYQTLAIAESFPVHLLFRLSTRYAQHQDPLPGLESVKHLEAVRKRALDDASFLPNLIRARLLDNPHRLFVVAKADPDYARKRDERNAERMNERKSRLSETDVQQIVREQAEFEHVETEGDPADALAKLPSLRVSDLPQRPRTIPTTFETDGKLDWLQNDVFSNGINYLEVEIDLSHVPVSLLLHGDVYTECLPKMGAGRSSYVELAERIAGHTSGVYAAVEVDAHATDPNRLVRTLQLSTSFLDGQADAALGILEDLLFAPDPTDRDRLSDVLVQAHAGQRSTIGLEGDSLARAHAASTISPEAWLSDQAHGLSEIRLFASLASQSKADRRQLDAEIDRLLAWRAAVSEAGHVYASFTGSAAERGTVRKRVGEWAARMRSAGTSVQRVEKPREPSALRVGLAAPMDVAFCALALRGPAYADPLAPTLAVAAQHLSLGHILEEIRFKGAAYGAWFRTNLLHRTLLFGSYRDPSIARTVRVFEGAADTVRAAAWSQRELDRTILVAAKDSLRPNRPREVTSTALYWHVHGLTDDVRARFYDGLVSVKADEARTSLLSVLEAQRPAASVCVVSSRDKLELENRELANALRIEDVFSTK